LTTLRLRLTLAAGLAATLMAAPALAHHSFAMFDRDHPATLQGVVKDFQWTNPHVWIELAVPDAKGADQQWSVECTSVNFMRREGWDRASLKPGDKIKLILFPLKDGSKGGQFNKLIELNGSPTNLPGYQQKLEQRQ
jgi:Family of unknown function (DUF6152)